MKQKSRMKENERKEKEKRNEIKTKANIAPTLESSDFSVYSELMPNQACCFKPIWFTLKSCEYRPHIKIK